MHLVHLEKNDFILPITNDVLPLLNCVEMSWEWGYISHSTNQTTYDPLDTEHMYVQSLTSVVQLPSITLPVRPSEADILFIHR